MKRKLPKEIEDSDIERFNIIRANLQGKEMTRTELRNALREKFGYPATDRMIQAITSGINPPIIKTPNGLYRVPETPVYKIRLQIAVKEYWSLSEKDAVKRGQKLDKKNPVKQDVIVVEQAIAILKSNGYRVMKQKVEWIEV